MYRHHSDIPSIPQAFYSTASQPSNGFFDGGGSGYNPLYLSPSTSSQSPPYSSSLPSSHLLRTNSTLSLHSYITDNKPQPPLVSSSSPCDFLGFDAGPVRRVFSTGDLRASGENGGQEGTVVAERVGRYTAEERKERVERYKSKRNQRNFHKKITYACRKTLADRRPRVRGRFARNEEMEVEAEVEAEAREEVMYDGYNYQAYNAYEQSYNAFEQSQDDACDQFQNDGGDSANEWWGQMQAVLATQDEEECYFDEDMLAKYLDMFSMNLLP